jgi:hypothetical protein
MSDQPIILGRVAIEPLPNWAMFPLPQQIVARPATRVGGLTISLGMVEGAPPARSHAESLRLACQVLPDEVDVAKAFQIERISWPPRLCGGASYRGKTDFYRLWYIHEGTGLLPALYACKLDLYQTAEAVREMIDCRKLVTSLKLRSVDA